jgi:hypothetical protein
MAVAATGSGGDTIAPKVKPTGQLPDMTQMGGDGHHRDRGQDQAEGKQADWLQAGAQFPHGRGNRRRIQQRRQEHQRHQLGIQLNTRQARQQADH